MLKTSLCPIEPEVISKFIIHPLGEVGNALPLSEIIHGRENP